MIPTEWCGNCVANRIIVTYENVIKYARMYQWRNKAVLSDIVFCVAGKFTIVNNGNQMKAVSNNQSI